MPNGLSLLSLASEPTDYDRAVELAMDGAREGSLKTGSYRVRFRYDCGEWKFFGRTTGTGRCRS